jgi:HK97 gp10 family phage protein
MSLVVAAELHDALLRQLTEGTLRERASAVVRQAALEVMDGAKRLCPVDTGTLRGSINVSVEEGGLAATVGTNVAYAPYVEYGTRRMAAKPYLRPAADEVRPHFEAAMREIAR